MLPIESEKKKQTIIRILFHSKGVDLSDLRSSSAQLDKEIQTQLDNISKNADAKANYKECGIAELIERGEIKMNEIVKKKEEKDAWEEAVAYAATLGMEELDNDVGMDFSPYDEDDGDELPTAVEGFKPVHVTF